MLNWFRHLFRWIGTGLVMAYGLAVLSGFVCAVFHVGPRSIEFPLADAQDLIVDRDGRIYLGVRFYGRVQEYAPDGTFLRGWPVGDRFRLRLSNGGQLQVIRRTEIRTYAADGTLLATEPNPNEQVPDTVRRSAGLAGGAYEMRGQVFFPHVVRMAADGRSSTVIATPWYKWPILFPFPGVLMFFAGAAMVGVTHLRRRGGSRHDR